MSATAGIVASRIPQMPTFMSSDIEMARRVTLGHFAEKHLFRSACHRTIGLMRRDGLPKLEISV